MANPVQTITGVIQPSYAFTRPSDTTAYAVGDLVANNTAAASVVPMTWRVGSATDSKHTVYVTSVRLKVDKASVTNAQFRIHLYKAIPTFTSAGDNGVFATVVATGYASWLGSFDVTALAVMADGVVGHAVPTEGTILPYHLTGLDPGSPVVLYGLIEALAAYSPNSASVITAEARAGVRWPLVSGCRSRGSRSVRRRW